jgi:hypothetical protein
MGKSKISKSQLPKYAGRLANGRQLRPHQLDAVLKSRLATNLDGALTRVVAGDRLPRRQSRVCQQWADEALEGCALARSAARLPSDRDRQRRPPSLERQEAFSDAATSKRRQSQYDSQLSDNSLWLSQESSFTFGLGDIVNDEPAYTLNFRPSRRGRKAAQLTGDDLTGLPLELSLAALGDDDALARFLIAPSDEERDVLQEAAGYTCSQAAPGITVIYELDSSCQSLPPPCASAFPDLISDNDNDMDDDGGASDDWAVLMRAGDDVEMGDTGCAASGGPDAWIVLG